MKLASAKLPVTTEVIDKTTPPRLGFEAVDEIDLGPRIITKGQHEANLLKLAMEKLVVVEQTTVAQPSA